jgi:DNA-binding MarR family transcriptional regulator
MRRAFPTGKFEKPGQSPGFLLWQATNRWQREIKRSLAPLGLTHVQFVLLAGLCWLEQDEGQGFITQKQLAEFCATDPMMTSQVLRALVQARLVDRQKHPNDARARHLQLSDQGYAKLVEALVFVEATDIHFFAKLGLRQIEFINCLRHLLD